MTETRTPTRGAELGPNWLILLISVTALALAAAALVVSLAWRAPSFGMIGGGQGMMGGGSGMMGRTSAATDPQPGMTGFVTGTKISPRTVRIWAGPGFAFYPSDVRVAPGETITFVVTTMGPATHEFMVGPADAVAGDVAGTPEVDGIGMMQTKSLTYTFDGPGPFGFACHEAGHFEAGMRGGITVVGAAP
jgi:plastocyanin